MYSLGSSRLNDMFAKLADTSVPTAFSDALFACRFTPAGRFYAWLCRVRAQDTKRSNDRCTTAPPCAPGSVDPDMQLFPCHLPVRPSSVFHRRLRGRRRNRQAKYKYSWLLTEYLLAYLVFTYVGSPKSVSQYQEKLGEWRLSGEQYLHWDMLRQELSLSCRIEPKGKSRGASRVNSHLQDNLIALTAPGGPDRFVAQLVNCCASEVKADRVKLPRRAAGIRPELFLKGEMQRQFCHQDEWTLHPEPPGRPRPCHLISREQERLLRKRLLDAGALRLVPLREAPRDPRTGKVITSGWFAVPHSEEWDRLITDRRPFNHGECRAKWLRLPLGSMLVRVILHRGMSLRGSGYDLSSYFTQLREHPSGLLRNLAGRIFSGEDAVELGGNADEKYVAGLLCIGMGDLNAVDVAQLTHLEMLSDGDALHLPGLLQWGDNFPQDASLLQGVYIDDGTVIAIVPTENLKLPGPDTILTQKVLETLESNGVDIAWHKGYGTGSRNKDGQYGVGEPDFTTWGTQVRNGPGLVGGEVNKRIDIAILLMRAISLRYTERNIVEHLLSLLTHPLCHRRCCLSFVHRAYKWASSLKYGRTVKWAADVKDEVLGCALLLFIADSHIRWPVSTRVAAVDATPSRGGSCFVTVSTTLAEGLYAATEHRGAATTLRPELLATPDLPVSPDVVDFYKAAPWKESRNHAFSETQHVNLQELSEIQLELEESVSLCGGPSRDVVASDSNVSICAAAKGRSPSLLLNGILRKVGAVSLFGRREAACIKVGTRENPADDPSRDVNLRTPGPCPAWLLPLLRPGRTEASWTEKVPAQCRMFREGFAGCARLTQYMNRQGVPTGRPCEPYPSKDNSRRHRSRYIRINDLCQPDVVAGIVRDIEGKLYVYWHFGICCAGWGKANTMNGGTRSQDCPMGGSGGREVLDRERESNDQAHVVCMLCLLLHQHGMYFSMENPFDSFLWVSDPVLHLLKQVGEAACVVHFCQCAYGLKLPGSTKNQYCKKRTTVLSTLRQLNHLERGCPGVSPGHAHDVAWGSVSIGGRTYSKAAAAGRYPDELCELWSELAADAIRQRFWNGTAPWQRRRA